jgi:2-polyprenyl-6-hydroxyphenyl methylase/3-demethylubiquinone-9 3-methyltransferase
MVKKIECQESWPDSWKYSYPYDLQEIYGKMLCHGYAYAYANRRKHTLELVQKVARPGAKVLDVAAAQGNFSLSLAELGYEVTWNDLREELADYVKLKWEKGIIHYAPGNVLNLGFQAYFDVILLAEVIEHVAHPDEFLLNIAKMIKPGGYIVMSTPNGEYVKNSLPKFSDFPDAREFEKIQFQPNSDGHIFLLHADEIKRLASQAGLSLLEIKFLTNPLTNGHIKLGTLLKFMPFSWVNTCEKFTSNLPLPVQKKLHASTVVLLGSPANINS